MLSLAEEQKKLVEESKNYANSLQRCNFCFKSQLSPAHPKKADWWYCSNCGKLNTDDIHKCSGCRNTSYLKYRCSKCDVVSSGSVCALCKSSRGTKFIM